MFQKPTMSTGLTNSELDELCSSLLRQEIWLGIHPCNHLQTTHHLQQQVLSQMDEWCMIINTARSFEKYGHFVALSKKKNSLSIFDPLALGIEDNNIMQYVRKFPFKINNLNTNAIQHPQSIFCGYMCLLFLILSHYNVCGINRFYSYFIHPPSLENDDITTKLLAHFIRTLHKRRTS